MALKYTRTVQLIHHYHEARAIMRLDPHITGAALARRMGVSERTGQYYRVLVLKVGPLERKEPEVTRAPSRAKVSPSAAQPMQQRPQPPMLEPAQPYPIPKFKDLQ